MNRDPLVNDAELQARELQRADQRYSNDLTQRLTYFVIGIEVVFCGYLLLNAEQLGKIQYSSVLFLLAGLAAIAGLFWRFFYNESFHCDVHNIRSWWLKATGWLQGAFYYAYVVLSIAFFMAMLAIGTAHLRVIETTSANVATLAAASEPVNDATISILGDNVVTFMNEHEMLLAYLALVLQFVGTALLAGFSIWGVKITTFDYFQVQGSPFTSVSVTPKWLVAAKVGLLSLLMGILILGIGTLAAMSR